jgi:hypothetical protein
MLTERIGDEKGYEDYVLNPGFQEIVGKPYPGNS